MKNNRISKLKYISETDILKLSGTWNEFPFADKLKAEVTIT